MNEGPKNQRLDKWLWAARFFKTRGLAKIAIDGGKVRMNSTTAKASAKLRIGDTVRLRKEQVEWTIEVLGLCEYRRPFAEASLLYKESEESRKIREEEAALRKLSSVNIPKTKGRPTKRDRRHIIAFKQQE